jgi:hypothetical protein
MIIKLSPASIEAWKRAERIGGHTIMERVIARAKAKLAGSLEGRPSYAYSECRIMAGVHEVMRVRLDAEGYACISGVSLSEIGVCPACDTTDCTCRDCGTPCSEPHGEERR